MSHPGDLVAVRRALLSVSDRRGLVELALALRRHGAELLATAGTAAALKGEGLPVTPLEQVTGMPQMMGGRVKTLHPRVHGAILARRDSPEDRDAMAAAGIEPIDLVCVNLYPFERRAGSGGAADAEVVEQIDIGGPTLLRSAAKNHEFVAVLTSPAQYARMIDELDAHQGGTTAPLRRALAAEAFSRCAAYDAAIAAWMAARTGEGGGPFPARLELSYVRHSTLRYGENPHQGAALYRPCGGEGRSIVTADVQGRKELSYNNVADAAAALELVDDLDALDPASAAAVIVKHAIPAGAAAAPGAAEALTAAWECDPVAAYGGIVASSRPIDLDAARWLAEGRRFLELIVAPQFHPAACARLRERFANVRLLAVGPRPPGRAPDGGGAWSLRSIPGGLLVQERDALIADPARWTHAAGPAPDARTLETAAFAWTVAKHLRSNAVAIARGRQLIGAGTGQVDRLTACRLAVQKAGGRIGPGAAAASEAFFPFPDGPAALIDAGVRCIVHPGGSKRDSETLALCDRGGVTCLLTGIRHFRH